jgi:hypothetical protein
VSSRAEEKERRRQERLAEEQKAQASADRRKRLAVVGGAVLALAVAALVVFALISGGDEDSGDGGPKLDVSIPAVAIADLADAAEAAGCEVKEVPNEGSTHTSDAVTYKANPPTSGDHNPVPAEDGIYEPGNEPAKEAYVHSLEHGRIIVQYKPGTPERTIAQLELVVNERFKGAEAYHMILMQNNTNMEPAVAATAWDNALTCPSMNDKVFDAIRAFRKQFTDKGPEFVP